MPDRHRLFYGVLGGASPEVVRWYKVALHPNAADFPSSWPVYLMVSLVFILFAGIFATLWQDDNRVKCFYFGVTFPLFVSAMLAGNLSLK